MKGYYVKKTPNVFIISHLIVDQSKIRKIKICEMCSPFMKSGLGLLRLVKSIVMKHFKY